MEDEPYSKRPKCDKSDRLDRCLWVIMIGNKLNLNHGSLLHLTLYEPVFEQDAYLLFPKIKRELRDRHFKTGNNIQKVVTDQLKSAPFEDYQR